MKNKENKVDEQLTVTDNLIETENAEFTENIFLIGDYISIIQCNFSVIGSICAPKLSFGNLFLNLSIFAKQSVGRGTDIRFNL